jgi:hypothetical protein
MEESGAYEGSMDEYRAIFESEDYHEGRTENMSSYVQDKQELRPEFNNLNYSQRIEE